MDEKAPGGLVPPGCRRIPGVVWEAAREAERLREGAAREAERVLAEARAGAAEVEAEARARGREEGLASVTGLLATTARRRDELLSASEHELVALALSIAECVVGRAAEMERGTVVEAAARALELARQRVELTLRAHPDDLEALRGARPELTATLPRARSVAILADASVRRGGVLLETEAGVVDATLETQLAALRRALAVEGDSTAPARHTDLARAPR